MAEILDALNKKKEEWKKVLKVSNSSIWNLKKKQYLIIDILIY